MDSSNGEGAILPTWTFVDNVNVKTSRELWEAMKSQGWNVDVCTIFFKSYSNIILMCSYDSIIGTLETSWSCFPDSLFPVEFLSRQTGQLKYITSVLSGTL